VAQPRTMFEKIWAAHVVEQHGDGSALLWIDRHIINEGSSIGAFAELAERGLPVARPGMHLAEAEGTISKHHAACGVTHPGHLQSHPDDGAPPTSWRDANMKAGVQIVPDMILGTWRLVRAYSTLDGKPHRQDPLGRGAVGFAHYMPDGRVAILIANDGRQHLSGDRYGSPEAELAEAARSFTGYCGTYTCGVDQVTHHLDVSSYENDNHTYYVRGASFDPDGLLTLETPQSPTSDGMRTMCLVWERQSRFG
jgi:Lipocalin-like domain